MRTSDFDSAAHALAHIDAGWNMQVAKVTRISANLTVTSHDLAELLRLSVLRYWWKNTVDFAKSRSHDEGGMQFTYELAQKFLTEGQIPSFFSDVDDTSVFGPAARVLARDATRTFCHAVADMLAKRGITVPTHAGTFDSVADGLHACCRTPQRMSHAANCPVALAEPCDLCAAEAGEPCASDCITEPGIPVT